jgi:hypothetical protein
MLWRWEAGAAPCLLFQPYAMLTEWLPLMGALLPFSCSQRIYRSTPGDSHKEKAGFPGLSKQVWNISAERQTRQVGEVRPLGM